MTAIVQYLVNRGLVVNLISVFVLALGAWSIYDINREAFPNVNLDQIVVGAVYPGATPEEMERLVVTPIEQELKSLDGINKMTSVSFPGSANITLELDPDANNRDRMVSDVQLKVNQVTLPDGLQSDPYVVEIDGSVFPVIRLALSAPRSSLELKRLNDQIEDDLLKLKGVARVTLIGQRKEELRITVDPQKLQKYRVSVLDISNLIRKWNINSPGGGSC